MYNEKGKDEDVLSRIKHIRTRVDRVHVEGLSRTSRQLVKRQLQPLMTTVDYEQLFSSVYDVRERLLQLGCFSRVGVLVDTSKGPAATHRGLEVTFSVEELSRVKGGVRTEVGHNEGSMSVTAELPNTLGAGESCQFQCQRGSRQSSALEASFRKPLHDACNTTVSLSAVQSANEFQPSQFSQLNRSLLFRLALNPRTNTWCTAEYEASWRHVRPLDATACPLAVREHTGPSLMSAVKTQLTRDTRDSVIMPTSGSLLSFGQQWAGLGGNVKFLRSTTQLQYNWTPGYRVTMQASLRGGVVLSPGSLTALADNMNGGGATLSRLCRRVLGPPSFCDQYTGGSCTPPHLAVSLADRFYLGGAVDVRGFAARQLGPSIDAAHVGADAFWAAALHVYTPLPLLSAWRRRRQRVGFSELFRTHAFVTTGNLFNILRQDTGSVCAWDDVWRLARVSCGIGLCVRLGESARVEINYCLPLRKQPTDGAQIGLQLGLGVDFL